MLDVNILASCEIGCGREATVYVVRSGEHNTFDTKTNMSPLYFALRVPRVLRCVSRYTQTACGLPRHPHVVHVFAVDGLSGMLLLEYVRGWTLDDELVCDVMSPRRAVVVIGQVLRGVEHLHKNGLMHGDVNPRNVLVDEDGDCKLTDYFVEPSGCFAVCGAPAYLAPEAVRGDAVQASDIWSVGCLMLAVTGRPPWQEAEVRLEDGSVVDLGCAGALLFHLSCRNIALQGPPEFTSCENSCKCLFFGELVDVFTTVEERASASQLLVKNKWC